MAFETRGLPGALFVLATTARKEGATKEIGRAAGGS